MDFVFAAVRGWQLQGWHTEGPREAIVGASIDTIVSVVLTVVLAYLAHHHIIRPAVERHREREREAERRHQEQMAAHAKIHRHLGIEEEP
jgi:peptidoglycan/LPS O-acetylase OafA/YrhL